MNVCMLRHLGEGMDTDNFQHIVLVLRFLFPMKKILSDSERKKKSSGTIFFRFENSFDHESPPTASLFQNF